MVLFHGSAMCHCSKPIHAELTVLWQLHYSEISGIFVSVNLRILMSSKKKVYMEALVKV